MDDDSNLEIIPAQVTKLPEEPHDIERLREHSIPSVSQDDSLHHSTNILL